MLHLTPPAGWGFRTTLRCLFGSDLAEGHARNSGEQDALFSTNILIRKLLCVEIYVSKMYYCFQQSYSKVVINPESTILAFFPIHRAVSDMFKSSPLL